MEVIKFDEYIKNYNQSLVCAIGEFDCIHLAHQLLIKKTIETANSLNYKSAVLLFDPHPSKVLFNKDVSVFSLKDKERIFSKFDLDYLIIINFNEDFSKVSPSDFVNKYLIKLNIKIAVVGFDFSFGYLGKGKATDIEKLSNNYIKTIIIDEQKDNNQKISSTLIRNYLLDGKLEEIKKLLGYNISLIGNVIIGHGVGHTINLPTANLAFKNPNIKLKEGVYAVKVYIDDLEYYGMMNVGYNRSFNQYHNLSYEVHILDFNEDIYGKEITVEFDKFLREEIIFNSIDDFKKQIEIDKLNIKMFFQVK